MSNSLVPVGVESANTNKGYALSPGIYLFNVSGIKGVEKIGTDSYDIRYIHNNASAVKYRVEAPDSAMEDLSEERGRLMFFPFYEDGEVSFEQVPVDDIKLIYGGNMTGSDINIIFPVRLDNGTGKQVSRQGFAYQWDADGLDDAETFPNEIDTFVLTVDTTDYTGTIDNSANTIALDGLGTDDPNDGTIAFTASPFSVITEDGELVYDGGNIEWTDDTTEWTATINLTTANGESNDYDITATVA